MLEPEEELLRLIVIVAAAAAVSTPFAGIAACARPRFEEELSHDEGHDQGGRLRIEGLLTEHLPAPLEEGDGDEDGSGSRRPCPRRQPQHECQDNLFARSCSNKLFSQWTIPSPSCCSLRHNRVVFLHNRSLFSCNKKSFWHSTRLPSNL